MSHTFPGTAVLRAIDDLRTWLPAAASLSDDDLRPVAAALSRRSLARGDALVRAGRDAFADALVVGGCLRVAAPDASGVDRIVTLAPAGWCVAGFDRRTPAALAVDALLDSEVLVLDRARVPSGPDRDRAVRLFVDAAVAGAVQRLLIATTRRAEDRYLLFRRVYPGLDRRIPQYHVAACLGISPEFLSKLRAHLIRTGRLAEVRAPAS